MTSNTEQSIVAAERELQLRNDNEKILRDQLQAITIKQTQLLTSLRNNTQRLQAALDQAKAQFENAQKMFDQAQLTFQKQQELFRRAQDEFRKKEEEHRKKVDALSKDIESDVQKLGGQMKDKEREILQEHTKAQQIEATIRDLRKRLENERRDEQAKAEREKKRLAQLETEQRRRGSRL